MDSDDESHGGPGLRPVAGAAVATGHPGTGAVRPPVADGGRRRSGRVRRQRGRAGAEGARPYVDRRAGSGAGRDHRTDRDFATGVARWTSTLAAMAASTARSAAGGTATLARLTVRSARIDLGADARTRSSAIRTCVPAAP